MTITIAVFTSRNEPCFQWFADALCDQTTDAERAALQVVLVDRLLWFPALFRGTRPHTEWIKLDDPTYHNPARRRAMDACVRGRFPFVHIPPKPNVYQGPWRLTPQDWFCAANARNTALLYAQHPYFVGIDDLAVPMPGWFDNVRHAAEGGYCVCGAYKKVLDLEVAAGRLSRCTEFPPGVDSRWNCGSDSGIVPWSGSGLFGCSFGVPLELALRCDGFAPECNAMGAEDYDFGMRVERAGGRFFYNRNMLTLESEERHHLDAPLPRESRVVTTSFLPTDYEGSTMSDHVLLNRLIRETDRTTPLIPERLSQQRERLAADGMVNVPREPLYDWRDGRPLDAARPSLISPFS